MEEIRQKLETGYYFFIEDIFRKALILVKLNLSSLVFYSSVYLLLNLLLFRFGYIGIAIQALLTGPFIAGFYNAFRISSYGYQIQLSDFFIVFHSPIQYTIAHILTGIITVAGIYLLIVPGIYFAVTYFFTIPFLINRKIGVWQAMEASRLIITHRFWQFFILILILAALNFVGALLFGIGLIFTLPFTYASIHVVFQEIFPIEDLEEEDNNDSINLDIFRQ